MLPSMGYSHVLSLTVPKDCRSCSHPSPVPAHGFQTHPRQWERSWSRALQPETPSGRGTATQGASSPQKADPSPVQQSYLRARASSQHPSSRTMSAELQPTHRATWPPQPGTKRSPRHFCTSLSKSLLEVNIYIYCKWLIGNAGLRAPLGSG